jgi:hypothetical protein
MVGVLAGFLSSHSGTGQVAAERRERNAPGRFHERAIEHDAIRFTKLEWNDAQAERTRRPPLAMVLRCGRSIPAKAPAN